MDLSGRLPDFQASIKDPSYLPLVRSFYFFFLSTTLLVTMSRVESPSYCGSQVTGLETAWKRLEASRRKCVVCGNVRELACREGNSRAGNLFNADAWPTNRDSASRQTMLISKALSPRWWLCYGSVYWLDCPILNVLRVPCVHVSSHLWCIRSVTYVQVSPT